MELAKMGCLQGCNSGFGGRILLKVIRGRGGRSCWRWQQGAFGANTNMRYVNRRRCGGVGGRGEALDDVILRG